MPLSVTSAMTGGLRRAINRNGLVLAIALVVIGAVWQVLFYSAVSAAVQPSGVSAQAASLPTVEVPLAVSAGGALIAILGIQYVIVVAMRTFVSGRSGTIPSEYYRRNMLPVLGNALVGALIYGLVVFIGSLLLVIPGIIAYIAFSFTLLYIATEDQNVLTALRSSWNTTRGHWLRLFLLLAIVFVISLAQGVLSVLAQAVFTAASGPALGQLASGVIVLPFTLVLIAILADAFVQLRNPRPSAR
jgi:membrane-anchored glycerophosphoryl diester phosphodiesterase (GDPDase)